MATKQQLRQERERTAEHRFYYAPSISRGDAWGHIVCDAEQKLKGIGKFHTKVDADLFLAAVRERYAEIGV